MPHHHGSVERIKVTAYVRLSESTVYYMCQHPVDMRKGINGLTKLVRSEMKKNMVLPLFPLVGMPVYSVLTVSSFMPSNSNLKYSSSL